MAPDLVPLFFSGRTEGPEQPSIGKAWDRAVIASRILKTSILFATGAIVSTVLLVGNPPALFPNTTASLADTSAPQAGITQSMPVISINRGRSGLTADCNRGADRRRNCGRC